MEGLRQIRVSKEKSDEDEQQVMSPISRMFHQPDSDVYIIIIIGFKTPINTHVFKANLATTLLKHPRFSSLQVVDQKNGGNMRWLKTEVNVENHVTVPAVNQEMDSADKFVEDYASNLSKTTISKSIPMWDIHLLNVRTSEAESIAILRVHHSIGDGASLMSLLLSCSRSVSDPNSLPIFPKSKRKNVNDSTRGVTWQVLMKMWWVVVIYWNTVVDIAMFLLTIFFLEDTKTPIKGTSRNGSSGRSRRFVHRTISLDDVKLVKNAMGATVNDVMVGVSQAGLSQYLNRKYGDEHEQGGKAKNNLPNNIRVRATSFVNLRPTLSGQASDDVTQRGNNTVNLGNKIGYVLFPFTIALRDDPLDYVRNAMVTGQRKKATLEPQCIYLMAKFLLDTCCSKVASFSTQTTLWFSNVVGPQDEVSYYGHPVAFIAPSLYGQPNALMIHVVSYADKMKIILSVDDNIIADPHQLCDDLENSLKFIKDAVIA